MKKALYTLLFITFGLWVNAQVWTEAFVLYSLPMQDWAYGDGDVTQIIIDGQTAEVCNQCFFQTMADPTAGIGINMRYNAQNRYTVGMELSYVEYKPATDFLRITMFRISPIVEYFFLPDAQIHPYVGGEVGITQPKVFFNGEVIRKSEISRTYMNVGLRGGLVFNIHEKVAARLGVKYVYLRDLPYVDISFGIGYNFGDF